MASTPRTQALTWSSNWQSFNSMLFLLKDLPWTANTYNLWDNFGKEGTITSIDIIPDKDGRRKPTARIWFTPPPLRNFWASGRYRINLAGGTHTVEISAKGVRDGLLVPSPVRPEVMYPGEIELSASELHVGVMLGDNLFWPMHTINATAAPAMVIDVKQRTLVFYFHQVVRYATPGQGPSSEEMPFVFKLRLKFLELSQVWESIDMKGKGLSLTMVAKSPPQLHRQTRDFASTFESESGSWKVGHTWFRQTALIHMPRLQANVATNLRKHGQIIDIANTPHFIAARWNTYQITFSPELVQTGIVKTLRDILTDHNVVIQNGFHLVQAEERPEPVWEFIDANNPSTTDSPSQILVTLWGDSHYIHLPFPVRYQLEVCISQGLLSEFTITKEFLLKLMEPGETHALRLLEHIATSNLKETYLDPMNIFSIPCPKGVTDAKIPKYCCFMRTARVTPTTILYSTPTVDTSNRVTRHYVEFADRFLRVRFTDEISLGRINSCTDMTNDEVFTRVKRTLANGITIGDRHYEFLAFGNSQFREHGAYFFAPLPDLTAANIRGWMGQFSHIKNVAKHTARIGQCFSTTRAYAGSSVDVHRCPDIIHDGKNFSDGVGKISRFLADMTVNDLKIETVTGLHPSAFQFRLGGSKGLLVVWPGVQPREVHIRDSQFKFEADSNGLEIIRWSQFNAATLNRQIILVLSALGIPDEAILKKMTDMIDNMDEITQNDFHAIALLQKFVDSNEVTFKLARMISDGFRKANDPFVNSLLQLWKTWNFKYLKDKARIPIEDGANVFGCVDEVGVLKGYFKRDAESANARGDPVSALPEIFLQVCRFDKTAHPRIIEGICVVARNPSLHPGDVRVVRAVDKPELRHLHDVVVFPRAGDQDLASMCSGGDLDGDDFLVFWDQDLVPKDPKYWFETPMDFKGRTAPNLDHDVTVNEITSFFAQYMKFDSLPRIAHAHMAQADWRNSGVRDEKCLLLAKLHSDAVDYNKTGAVAEIKRDVMPNRWPHFMEKKYKPLHQIYHSKKILGQLYDRVETKTFTPNLNLPFDSRILNCSFVPASKKYLEFAAGLKLQYDAAMRRLMAQYGIKTEFEVWSAFVLDHTSLSSNYKIHEEVGHRASILCNGFQQACYEMIDGRASRDLAPLAVALYRVTHDATVKALKELQKQKEKKEADKAYGDDWDWEQESEVNEDAGREPLISFPWIFHECLGDVAMCRVRERDPDSSEPEIPSEAFPNAKKYIRAEVDKILVDLAGESSGHSAPWLGGLRSPAAEPYRPIITTPDMPSAILARSPDSNNNDFGQKSGVDAHQALGTVDVNLPVGGGSHQKISEAQGKEGEPEQIIEEENVKPSATDDLLSLLDLG
ncbi:RNA-directed RNA polymerase (Sad-1) [Penicillium herquei]|nr:RNA-directed RNA polymerase (Sad-1) [Penicillium herquei]